MFPTYFREMTIILVAPQWNIYQLQCIKSQISPYQNSRVPSWMWCDEHQDYNAKKRRKNPSLTTFVYLQPGQTTFPDDTWLTGVTALSWMMQESSGTANIDP